VDVIGFTVELDQLAAPILAALGRDLFQTLKDGPRDALPPLLGHDNQVVAERVNAVKKEKACGT